VAVHFTDRFIAMLGNNESPVSYLRWSIISAVGAAIARSAWLQFGTKQYYPSQYILLIGAPGSRKSTGIKTAAQLLRKAGYINFAPNKGRKEALWTHLAKLGMPEEMRKRMEHKAAEVIDEDTVDEVTLLDLLNAAEQRDGLLPAHMLISASEWSDFMGREGDLVDNLTELHDNIDEWNYIRTTKSSLYIREPTISMIGGATPASFGSVLPGNALSTGFVRRLILVHGEHTKKVPFPDPANEEIAAELIAMLQWIMANPVGEVCFTTDARELLAEIYMQEHFLTATQMQSYAFGRQEHLCKMLIISAVARQSDTITVDDVLFANTILLRTEISMPKALGHFGGARNASPANAVLEYINTAKHPPTLKELHHRLATEVENLDALKKLVQMLKETSRIKMINMAGGARYLPKSTFEELIAKNPYFKQHYLTPDEQI
jgi:hypothetical protein